MWRFIYKLMFLSLLYQNAIQYGNVLNVMMGKYTVYSIFVIVFVIILIKINYLANKDLSTKTFSLSLNNFHES